MKNTLCLSWMMILLYVMQFIVLPYLLPLYYPNSNEAMFILIVPHVVMAFCVNIWCDVRISTWFLLGVLYAGLILIYRGNGLYRFGMRGISLDGASLVYSFELLMLQLIVMVIALFMMQCILRWIKIKLMK